MSQKIQKILIRSVLIGTLVFGVVFALLESKVSQYQGSTLFAISARSEVGAQQMEIVAKNVEIILQNELFRREVSNALYEKTEEWKRFSLDIKNPAGSVFVLSYEDNSVDPYTMREAIGVVRVEAFKTIARNYDFSRDFSIHFLDSGRVVESNKILYHIAVAGFFAFLSLILVEGSVYFRSVRKSEEEFRLVLQKRMLEKEGALGMVEEF